MKRNFTLALLAMATLAHAQQKTISGFTSASAAKEPGTEQAFDQSLSAPRIGETINELSKFPHYIGFAGHILYMQPVSETIFMQKFAHQ
jgi:N-acetylated-alpha-linked acidic dipeptidase